MKIKYRILPILADLIQTTFSACDGIVFDSLTICPHCNSSLSGYDAKKKLFALLSDGDRQKGVFVWVKRFRCKGCHTIVYAHQPFYSYTRIGSPVVDLCVTLAASMPYARVSTYLEQIGVVVDRWSVRNYVLRGYPAPPTVEMFGISLPLSVISLSNRAAQIPEGSMLGPADILEACRFPSLARTTPDTPSN
jgi:hypothetical protein